MEGIYLTEEGKKAIEDKIAELENLYSFWDDIENTEINAKIEIYKEILESAIILPVEESWENVIDIHDPEGACNKYYPNGVIIKKEE
jgi:hypothetical protein